MSEEIESIEDTLSYICDCQLATVLIMAGKKDRSKFEYERQKSIAQYIVNAIMKFDIDPGPTRCRIVKERHNGNIEYWIKPFEQN